MSALQIVLANVKKHNIFLNIAKVKMSGHGHTFVIAYTTFRPIRDTRQMKIVGHAFALLLFHFID